MNTDTGELRNMTKLYAKSLAENEKDNFKPVPESLQDEVQKKLGEKESVFVDLDKDTPLSNWAKKERKKDFKKHKKTKRKVVKASRKVNRR